MRGFCIALAVSTLALGVTGCGRDVIAPDRAGDLPAVRYSENGAGGFDFGPVVAERAPGEPAPVSWVVSDLGGLYSLVVENGAGDASRQTGAAVVWVNGVIVLGEDAFSADAPGHGRPPRHEIPVFVGGPAVIAVEVRGAPGTRVGVGLRGGAVVGPEGAVLPLGDGGALVIPEGAVPAGTSITIEPTDELPSFTTGTPGLTFYELGPSGIEFAVPVEIRIPYDAALLPSGVREEDLRLYTPANGVWGQVPGSFVDPAAGLVIGTTTHFSPFGPLAAAVTWCTDGSAFPTIRAAEEAVAPAGTIEVCDGTHFFSNDPAENTLRKNVTLAPADGAAPVVAAVGAARLTIVGGEPGTITIRDLTFTSNPLAMIIAGSDVDVVRIEGVTFFAFGTAAFQFGAFPEQGPHLVVERSTFIGGTVGAFAVQNARMDVFDSEFRNTGFAAIQYQGGAYGRAERNHMERCGFVACVHGVAVNGPMVVADNSMLVPAGSTTQAAIRMSTASGVAGHHMTGNDIQALGGPADPNDPGSYALTEAGIRFLGAGFQVPATVADNVIRGAAFGIRAAGTWAVSGLDNAVDLSFAPLHLEDNATAQIHSSDFTDYVQAMFGSVPAFNASSLTCNWWGSAAGPSGAPADIESTVYTPFATQPVRGTSTTIC